MVTRTRNRKWQELEKNNTPLEKLARHFEAHNRSEGKSPRTVEWYERVLRYFQNYLEEQGQSAMLGDLTLQVVREFVVCLQTRERWHGHPNPPSGDGHLSAISVNNYVRGIRAFFSWLHRECYTDENVLASLKPPRFPRTLVDVLKDEEVGVILNCLDGDTASGCRDIAMIIIFLDCGAHRLTPGDDYPDFVVPLARAVAKREVERGIAVGCPFFQGGRPVLR